MKLLKRILDSKYLHFYLFPIIAIGIILKSLNFDILHSYINGGDTAQSYNFDAYINQSLTIWDTSSIGSIVPLNFESFIPNVFLTIINFLVHNNVLSINIYWIIVLLLIELSLYLFYTEFFEPKIAIYGTIVTVFSLFFLIFFHTPITFQLIGFSLFPLLYAFLSRFMRSGNYAYIILYSISIFISFRSLNVVLLSNIFVTLLYFLINKKYIKVKAFLIFYVSAGILTILLCLPFLFNLFLYNASPESKNPALADYNTGALSINYLFTLVTIFNFTPNFGFINQLSESPGWQAQAFSKAIHTIILLPLSYIPIILATLALVFKRKSRTVIVLGLVLFALIFLAKGLNEPFGIVNQYLYNNKFFALFFRSGALYFLYLIVPLMVLLILSNRNKYAYGALGVYCTINFILIFIVFNPVAINWKTKLPSSYVALQQHIKPNDRYLALPISDHFVGYSATEDGYGGPDRINQITSSSLLTIAQGTLVPNEYIKDIQNIRANPSQISDYAHLMNVQHIIIEKNLISTSHYVVNDVNSYRPYLKDPDWSMSYSNDDFEIFDYKPTQNTSNVSVTDQNDTLITKTPDLTNKLDFVRSISNTNPTFISPTSDLNLGSTNNIEEAFNLDLPLKTKTLDLNKGITTIYKNTSAYSLYTDTNNGVFTLKKTYLHNPTLNGRDIPFKTAPDTDLINQKVTDDLPYIETANGLYSLQRNKIQDLGFSGDTSSIDLIRTTTNQIQNANFKDGPWTSKVEDCSGYSANTNNSMMVDKISDAANMLTLSSKNGIACTNTLFPVSPGTKILSFDYKGQDSDTAGYYISFNDKRKTSLGLKLPSRSDWSSYALKVHVPVGATYARIYVYSYGLNGGNTNTISYSNFHFSNIASTDTIHTDITNAIYENIRLNEASNPSNPVLEPPQEYNTSNIVPNGSFEKGLWSQKVEDCTANNSNGDISASLESDNVLSGNSSLKLTSSRHVACTSITFPVKALQSYNFSLGYYLKNARRGGYYIEFNDPGKTHISKELDSSNSSKWNNNFSVVNSPKNASSLTLVLYSFDDRINNTVLYDNIIISERPSDDTSFYIITSKNSPIIKHGQTSFDLIKSSSTQKTLHLKNAVGTLYVNLHDSYQDPWVLKTIDDDIIGRHTELNSYMNSWQINVEKICTRYKNLCTENKDATYDFDVKIEYSPQKTYSIVTFISIVVLISSLLITLIKLFKLKKKIEYIRT